VYILFTMHTHDSGRSVKLLLVFASTVTVGIHDHSLFFPRLLRVLKLGLPFNEWRGLSITGHSPSNGGHSARVAQSV
jgi:hypothetical protein